MKLKSTTNDNTASFYPNAEIVICKNSIDVKDTTFHIAYKIDIYAKEPVRRDYIFVDAKSGNILAVNPILVNATGTAATRYSGTRNISTQQNGNIFRLRGYDNNRSVETYNMKKSTNYNTAVDFTDNNNWTATEFHNANKDDAALEAHWSAMTTYDYFKNIHRRNSFDNNGTTVKCYVHYGVNYVNAFWDGSVLTFGDGNGTTVDTYVCLDVVAHGVCANTAELVYSGESGAIDESLGDIWGACVENYVNNQYGINKDVWLHREEVGASNRSLSNPENYGQPDTYGGTYWVNTNGCVPSQYNDYCGVHINSGIMNYWFYLLAVGGSGINDNGDSYNVTGIGIEKAAKIVYRAETVYMTANTNFAAARTYTIQAATELYGANSQEVISVTNAWYAVGVGNQYVFNISGTNSLYTFQQSTYSIPVLPAGATITWSVSNNVNIISGQGTSQVTIRACSGYNATITATLSGAVNQILVKNLWLINGELTTTNYTTHIEAVLTHPYAQCYDWEYSSNFTYSPNSAVISCTNQSTLELTPKNGNTGGYIKARAKSNFCTNPDPWSQVDAHIWTWQPELTGYFNPVRGEPFFASLVEDVPNYASHGNIEYHWYFDNELFDITTESFIESCDWPCGDHMFKVVIVVDNNESSAEIDFWGMCTGGRSSTYSAAYPNPASTELTIDKTEDTNSNFAVQNSKAAAKPSTVKVLLYSHGTTKLVYSKDYSSEDKQIKVQDNFRL